MDVSIPGRPAFRAWFRAGKHQSGMRVRRPLSPKWAPRRKAVRCPGQDEISITKPFCSLYSTNFPGNEPILKGSAATSTALSGASWTSAPGQPGIIFRCQTATREEVFDRRTRNHTVKRMKRMQAQKPAKRV